MIYQIPLKKLILALLTIFTLQPLAGMELSPDKRARIDDSNEAQGKAPEEQLQPTGENLLKAAKEGSQADCSWLINQRVDVNSQNEIYLQTPLILAAQLGHYNVCELLIKHRAQVSAQDFIKETALMKAAVNGHKEICELLIKHRAQVDAQSLRRETALMKAACFGHKDVCELLIAKGANVNAKDEGGRTALNFAVLEGHTEICELLMAKVASYDIDMILIEAADTENKDNKDVSELLIAKGANVNAKDERGRTALMCAAHWENKDLCKLLIAKGAQANAQDNEGKTALHYAAFETFETNGEICKILIEHGANPNALMNDGTPVLIHCLNVGEDFELPECTYECVKMLLKHRADVNLLSNGKQIDRDNAQNNTGSTALMEAARLASIKIFKLLLQYGADHDYQNNLGESAITLAHTRAAGGDEEDDGHNILTLLTNPSEMQKAMKKPKNPIFKINLPGYFKEDTSSSQSSPENSSEEQDDEEEEEEQKESQGDSKSICLALEERKIGMKCRK